LLLPPEAFKEYNEWFETDKAIITRIKILIREINNDSFKGIGKPEPLKGNWKGFWSRRINDEHRLVYQVTDTHILIVKCRGHY
jgi:toxin YoeB